MAEPEKIRIAKITATQAIVVALITALAGVLGVGIQKYGFGGSDADSPSRQDAIRFHGIEFHVQEEVKRYRVVLDVDGIPYSYPGRSVWKDVGPKTPEQAFPLKAGRSEHSVGLEVFYETVTGGQFQAITEQDKTLSGDSGITNLRVFRRTGASRGGSAVATVQVEITKL
jgi:hypothetical protein